MSTRIVPKSRKTPYEHKVREHNRKTKKNIKVHVHKYTRGDGDKPEIEVKPRSTKAKEQGSKLGYGPLYNVSVMYQERGPEMFAVRTANPQSALDYSITNSHSPYVPSEIVLTRR